MLFGTKEEQDLYVTQAVKNLICDEASFNMTRRTPFHSWHEVFGFLHEEVKELEDAHSKVTDEYINYEHLIMTDADHEEMVKQLNLIIHEATSTIHEAIHVAAVATKGIKQMEERRNGKRVQMLDSR